jgi:CRP-like cAMP-binding protein
LLWDKLLVLSGFDWQGQMVTGDPRISSQSLATADLFVGLPISVLEVVAAAARPRRVARGIRIFNQGDDGVRAHTVIEGGVRISQTGSDGAQVVLRFIGPGNIFGTVALFTDGCYPADATALSDTLEASWSEPELLDLMTRYPQIAINVIRIIGQRLQEMQNRMRELATQRAERRIAHALVRLAQQSGHSTAAGTAIPFPLRRKDIADVAGTTLHTASRILTGWEKAGLLVSERRLLTIQNLSELLRIAEEAAD